MTMTTREEGSRQNGSTVAVAPIFVQKVILGVFMAFFALVATPIDEASVFAQEGTQYTQPVTEASFEIIFARLMAYHNQNVPGSDNASAELFANELVARLRTIREQQSSAPATQQLAQQEDPRVAAIRNYFIGKGNLPAKDYAEDFVFYADKYNIDFRIIAAISFVETTGCKYTIENADITKRKNNCLGFGNYSFPSIEAGIDKVSSTWAGVDPVNGHYYRGKSFNGKVRAYNSVRYGYETTLVKVMNGIMPDAQAKALDKKMRQEQSIVAFSG